MIRFIHIILNKFHIITLTEILLLSLIFFHMTFSLQNKGGSEIIAVRIEDVLKTLNFQKHAG